MATKKVLLKDLKVAELKIELEERELETSGLKAALQQRLRDALWTAGDDPEAFLFEVTCGSADISRILDEKFREQSGNLDEKLREQSGTFKDELREQSRNLDEKFQEQSGNFKDELREQSRNLDEKLLEQSRNLNEKFQEQSGNFKDELREQSRNLDEKLLEQSRNLDEKLRDQSGNFNELQNKLLEQSRNLDEKFLQQSEVLEDKLVEKILEETRNLQENMGEILLKQENKIKNLEQIMTGLRTFGEQLPAENKEPRTMREPAETSRVKIKPPTFDGNSSWPNYFKQFEAAAKVSGWTASEKTSSLIVALRGDAINVLQTMPPEEQQDFNKLVNRLEMRYGQTHLTEVYRAQLRNSCQKSGESLQEFEADVARLARLAYPAAPEEFLQRLTVYTFMDGIRDRQPTGSKGGSP